MDWIKLESRQPEVGSYVWAKNGTDGKDLLGYVIKGLHGLQINTLSGIRYFTHWTTYNVIY